MSICAKDSEVLLIDQYALRRAGFASLLGDWAKSSNVSIEAVTPDAVETSLEKLPSCHLVILNLGSQSIDEDSTRHLMNLLRTRVPDTPLAIVSDRTDAREVTSAFKSGASGFIPTSLTPSVVLQSLSFIMKGGAYFPLSALLQNVELPEYKPDTDDGQFGDGEAAEGGTEGHTPCMETRRTKSRIMQLTARQHDVLGQLRDGKSNKAIAGALNLTEATVKTHLHQIMRKLGVTNRTQAALWAVKSDLNGSNSSSLIV